MTAIDGDQQVFAVGINCVSPKIVTAAVKEIHRFTDKPIVVYLNLGASYNPATKKWEEIHAQFDFTALARSRMVPIWRTFDWWLLHNGTRTG